MKQDKVFLEKTKSEKSDSSSTGKPSNLVAKYSTNFMNRIFTREKQQAPEKPKNNCLFDVMNNKKKLKIHLLLNLIGV